MGTLEDSDTEEVHLGEPMIVYDIDGNQHTFTPRLNVCAHFPDPATRASR